MKNVTSSGGVVIYRGKILLLFMNYKNIYEGWVLPKGTVEEGESLEETAVREVREEAGAKGKCVEYLDACEYEFRSGKEKVHKTVHWYLISSAGYYSRPQRKEYFTDSGYYKYHEAYYMMRYENERAMVKKAYQRYQDLARSGEWTVPGYGKNKLSKRVR